MERTFRLIGPSVGDPTVPAGAHPIIHHVITPCVVHDAYIRQTTAGIECRCAAVEHNTQMFPTAAPVCGAIETAPPIRYIAVVAAVFAHVDVPIGAFGIEKQETVHRPLESFEAAADWIARHALERIERRIAIDRVSQPLIHVVQLRIIGFGRRSAGRSNKNNRCRKAKHLRLHHITPEWEPRLTFRGNCRDGLRVHP